MDTWPNQEALNKALNIYRTYMRAFIIFHLKKVPGQKVEDIVMDSLDDAGQSDRADEIDRLLRQSNRDIKSIIDVDDFPRLVNTNWNSSFKIPLNDDKTFRNQLWLIKDGRDQSWAHPPEGDAESEGTRAYLFFIADVLRKINRPDKQHEVEGIRDALFADDTAERLEKAEEENVEYKKSLAEAEQSLATAESEKNEYAKKNTVLSKQVDEKENQRKKLDKQLKRAKAQNDKYKKDIAGTKQRLEKSEAAQVDYKDRLETKSKELNGTHAEWKETEERLATALNQLAASQAVEKGIAARLISAQNLFTVAAIGNQTVQDVYPPIEKDSTVRILDRRGVDKKNYLLELLEQKQPTLIYVQSEERIDQLLTLVGPERARMIGRHDKQTSEAEEAMILEKLRNAELIAVVSDTALSTLTSSHSVEHFVFCHLASGLDKFFERCQSAFASEKNAYLHLIYESKQDIEKIAEKFLDENALRELYKKFRDYTPMDGNLVNPANLYDKLCKDRELEITELGIETSLSIFEELGFLKQNEGGIKRVSPPSTGTQLENSVTYCRGERLKKEIANSPAFQYEQSIEQIWEEILEKLDVDGEQILREVNTDEMYSSVSEIESDQQPMETVENDSEPDEGDTESDQTPEPERANATVPEETFREIRSRSAAGEANSELAEEDSEEEPEVKQSEFWQPIRDGEFGELFTGKPVPISNEGWISKSIHNIGICLYLNNHRCYVQIYFHGANGSERREKIMALFPKSEYAYTYRDTPRETKVQFPVLDKGRKDQDDWDEIRKKLVAIGTDIYNKIDESDL